MSKKLTTEEFIIRAREVHDDKYDYSLVDYQDYKLKIKIICFEHGIFEQTPDKHLFGQGCVKCGINKSSNAKKLNTSSFIKKAIKVHGDRYNYDNVNYIDCSVKLAVES